MRYNEFEPSEIIDLYDDLTIEDMITNKTVLRRMKEFGDTICGNIGILNNGVVKAVRDMSIDDKFNTVMFYKYSEKEFIRI